MGAEQVMGMMPMAGITAWHGSPHKFSKFDMSKIGTGEGAQAYGHGIYAAENPKVATGYQKALSRGETTIAGKTYADDGTGYTLEGVLNSYKGDVGKAQKRANSMIEYYQKNIDKYAGQTDPHALGVIDSAGRSRSEWEALNNQLSDLAGKPMDFQKGNLYKVDIPDDQIAKMLDWDKPLSEQPHLQGLARKYFPDEYEGVMRRGTVRQELDSLVDQYKQPGDKAPIDSIRRSPDAIQKRFSELAKEHSQLSGGPESGESFYRQLGNKLKPGEDYSQDEVSRMLNESGIPGIKYLDGGSRSGGQGTSNFVLFSDEIAKILERNDQPIGLIHGR
jgi:hypothetical protein